MNTADQLIQQRERLAPSSPRRREFNRAVYDSRHAQLVSEVTWEKAWEDTFLALVKEANLGEP
jgi:hypothetical protein